VNVMCFNCSKPVTWSPDSGWTHPGAGDACDGTGAWVAAPESGTGRCSASLRVGGRDATCDGPPDGHEVHAATWGGPARLYPAARWSTP
jgi:hypothetical protein